ncbi:hypothetical protein BGZ60DRAFT_93724 [Tricladium varicosporioides]|nr:hypothetical protein BGZ60DRAFT_93724 [Hymenoscyphus varicosporioides]
MSRAIDKETVASLQSDDPTSVYEDISCTLCWDRGQLLEIEFLGKSHPLPPGTNFLLDGNNIAIPKAKLVQAFVTARQIFFNLAKDCPKDKLQVLGNAAAVILLMDPEHITAANSRKKILLRAGSLSPEIFKAMLRKELLFVNSFLTARLHRHTKSPTLWGHRRWVLEKCKAMGMGYDIHQDLHSIILVAAERHPRNYYAWSHLRWVIQNLCVGEKTKSEISPFIKNWCLRHPSDTSGFSFLLFCLAPLKTPENVPRSDASTFVCEEVLGLAVSFKWTFESVWVFLRTIVATELVASSQRLVFLEAINNLLTTCEGEPKARSNLQNAMQWFEENQQANGS